MKPTLQITVEKLQADNLAQRQEECLLLPVLAAPKQDELLTGIDSSGALTEALTHHGGGASGLHIAVTPSEMEPGQLLLVWTKYDQALPPRRARLQAMRNALARLVSLKVESAAIVMREHPQATDTHLPWAIEQASKIAETACYRYRSTLSEDKDEGGVCLKRITLLVEDSLSLKDAEAAAQRGAAIGLGINSARELGDLPANICTPSFLADQARKMAETHDCLSVEILDQKKLESEGMRSLLSVADGSIQPPFLYRLRYRNGGKNTPTVALIGKGVTFDTGGISIKPSSNMADMKYDMSGAGAVMGVMHALAELKPAVNVDGIVATVENMPGGRATRPGDVVTSLSGKTIEILNTDAEGRLILCDALTWAAREKPDMMVDIATLTGACVVALGHEAAGLYSNNDALAAQLSEAGEISGERAWRMPLWEEYNRLLKSRYADIANISRGPGAGSITAACFLQRFVEDDIPWAHLDVAGTAHNDGAKRASTGRPVGMLMQFLLDNA